MTMTMDDAWHEAMAACQVYGALARRRGVDRGIDQAPAELMAKIAERLGDSFQYEPEAIGALRGVGLEVARQVAVEKIGVDVPYVELERFRQRVERALEDLALAWVDLRYGVEYAEDRIKPGLDTV